MSHEQHTCKHFDPGCVGVVGLFCSRSWDGWLCWDDAPAGTYASQNCPDYFSNFDPTGEQREPRVLSTSVIVSCVLWLANKILTETKESGN